MSRRWHALTTGGFILLWLFAILDSGATPAPSPVPETTPAAPASGTAAASPAPAPAPGDPHPGRGDGAVPGGEPEDAQDSEEASSPTTGKAPSPHPGAAKAPDSARASPATTAEEEGEEGEHGQDQAATGQREGGAEEPGSSAEATAVETPPYLELEKRLDVLPPPELGKDATAIPNPFTFAGTAAAVADDDRLKNVKFTGILIGKVRIARIDDARLQEGDTFDIDAKNGKVKKMETGRGEFKLVRIERGRAIVEDQAAKESQIPYVKRRLDPEPLKTKKAAGAGTPGGSTPAGPGGQRPQGSGGDTHPQ